LRSEEWAKNIRETMKITTLVDNNRLDSRPDFYCWGDKEVEFHRCNSCGCLTHYVTTQKCSEDILAVNMRMAENEVISRIPVRKINGASC
jgi:hypothetical protein